MLAAIQNTTLLDDVFHEDPTTNSLEAYIADMTGHEAALLVLSGTMGNQLAIRTHLTQPPHSVLADARSHIIGWYLPLLPTPRTPPPTQSHSPVHQLTLHNREAGGIASLSGALAIPVTPSNSHHLTLKDIQTHAITSPDIHACPTSLIALENTLAGTILPITAAQAIAAWSRAQTPPIKLHLDGARLWEAIAANAGSLRAYAACFNSLSLCFSKGLGAPIGSIIVGSRAFIARARHIRKSLGGGLRQSGVIAAPARVAVDDTFCAGKLAASHRRAAAIARLWTQRGGRLLRDCETNMVWFDLAAAGCSAETFVREALKLGVKVMGGRLVVHYQIGEEAVERLARIMDVILAGKSAPADNVVNGLDTKAKALIETEVE